MGSIQLLQKKRWRKNGSFYRGGRTNGPPPNNNNNKGRVPFRGPPIGTRAFLAHLTREVVDPYRRFKL